MYLNCHSYHSLRYGTIPIAELVQLGVTHGATAMALTDINTITGIYDFAKACSASGIKPLAGIEFRQENTLRFIGIARNFEGIGELNRFLTAHNVEESPLPYQAPAFKNAYVVYPLGNVPDTLQEHEYIGIRPEQLPLLFQDRWKALLDKMVVLQPVTVRNDAEFELHKVLRAIDTNQLLSKLTEDDFGKASERMLPLSDLIALYSDYPQIIENTQRLMDSCNFEFNYELPKNRKFYTKSRQADMKLLSSLAHQGMVKRYGRNNKAAKARVERELAVIDELEFSGYFLITWDIVRYSNSMGFMHIGRGSGANSIIAYCLGITDICPLELDLYFVIRFRLKPPTASVGRLLC